MRGAHEGAGGGYAVLQDRCVAVCIGLATKVVLLYLILIVEIAGVGIVCINKLILKLFVLLGAFSQQLIVYSVSFRTAGWSVDEPALQQLALEKNKKKKKKKDVYGTTPKTINR